MGTYRISISGIIGPVYAGHKYDLIPETKERVKSCHWERADKHYENFDPEKLLFDHPKERVLPFNVDHLHRIIVNQTNIDLLTNNFSIKLYWIVIVVPSCLHSILKNNRNHAQKCDYYDKSFTENISIY